MRKPLQRLQCAPPTRRYAAFQILFARPLTQDTRFRRVPNRNYKKAAAMTRVYVSFCKPVNFDTATALIRTCREVVSDGQHNWDKLRLMISSGGGNITAAFAAYNEIRSMPIELETLNTGATDSPALMIFMAGKKRYACARSAFQLRQPSWWFQSKDDVALSVISDAARWLQEYQQMMAEAIAEGTDGQLTRDKVVEMIQTGTTLNPQQAKDIGLIHDIIEPTIPAGARWWQA